MLLSGNSLNFWLAKEGVSTISIGMFSLIALPYSINFIWAPLIDRVRVPYFTERFGQHVSWVIILQFLSSFIILCLSTLNPMQDLLEIAIFSFLLSVCASTQDIAFNSLRASISTKETLGNFSAIHILGYRLGAIIASSGAIYFSAFMSWNKIYGFFSILLLLVVWVFVYLIHHCDKSTEYNKANKGLNIDFRLLLWLLLFLILYRVADNFINVMINPFLLHLQFNEYEIAVAGKLCGIMSATAGSFFAGYYMSRYNNLAKLLLYFGVLHLVAHSFFILQSIFLHNLTLLYFVIAVESFTGGMTMTVYMAFITTLCRGSSARYSFFSSMMGISRAILPAISGYIVAQYGWVMFFSFVTILAAPSLLILYFIIDTKIDSTN